MPDVTRSLYNLHLLDELSRKKTVIHRLHPLAKLVVTMGYLVAVVSFNRYEMSRLLPLFLYPVMIMALAEIPVLPVLKRILLIEPLILGIGILNPLLDKHMVVVSGITFSRGWITFFSVVIKCSLTAAAALLLIATTGMDRLAFALRMIRIPRLLVLQLVLTYRYITVLLEEVARILQAYRLRSPGQRGVHRSAWGSLAGQLLLRTYERAQRVYQAMLLRGFNGEFTTGSLQSWRGCDVGYIIFWGLFFAIARCFDLPALAGSFMMGG